jgi:hypothetical protein
VEVVGNTTARAQAREEKSGTAINNAAIAAATWRDAPAKYHHLFIGMPPNRSYELKMIEPQVFNVA